MHQTKPINIGLLDCLLQSKTAITRESLALTLGLSRDRIADELHVLTQYGCEFNEHPQHGIVMIQSGLGVWSDYLESESSVLRNVLVYGTTGSTQDICKDISNSITANPQDLDHTLVIAHHQQNGRGRLGRKWIAPEGKTISCSMIKTINHQSDAEVINRLTLAVSVAIARTVEFFLPEKKGVTQIKWPNDVWVDGRKIAGILVETVHANRQPTGLGYPSSSEEGLAAAIIGIGLNAGLDEGDIKSAKLDGPKYLPTSLKICGCDVDRLLVLRKLLEFVDEMIERADDEAIMNEWRGRCLQFKQQVRLRNGTQEIVGEVVDIDPALGLIVRNDRGMLTHMPAASTTVI
ncbi:Bifunctional ligase/repressor BirA [Poriferisphaera corsica]|uniref:Bifunctional ligase/repressor BirA n=1 Tax=Poriferisphaera corsica TaxID=2528020 RepID=A0A517YUY7_9BACT|nr:Bifunctional ligase/repressor BirA [Poriferisphaera corsica]